MSPESQLLDRYLVAQPAENAPDPGQQLGVVVRLGDVVLGIVSDQICLAVSLDDGREHQDGKVGATLDPPGQGLAIHLRHQQIEDHQVRPGGVQLLEGLARAARPGHLEAVAGQPFGERVEMRHVVVHKQQPRLDHEAQFYGGHESGGRLATATCQSRPASSRALVIAASSIAGVRRPVKVFCWLGW